MVKMCLGKILLFMVAAAYAQDFEEQLDDPQKIVVGDMILTRRQHQWLYSNKTVKRHGIANKDDRWPGGIMPIKIDPKIGSNLRKALKDATAYISKGTCVKFLFDFDPRNHPIYLNVVPDKNGVCTAWVGYIKGATMTLAPNCNKFPIVHELLHALGFQHMHTAVERDNYININWDNIEPEYKYAYDKIAKDGLFGTPYEYDSIMHYKPYGFALNPKIPTITPKGGRQAPNMGQGDRMTPGDFKRVNRMYKCPGLM